MVESLHNHTILSDGKLSHREMFELAESLSMGAIAFTDHDALPSKDVIKYLNSKKESKTKWVIGIEMTTMSPFKKDNYIHVVGLFVDPENKALKEHCKKMQAARIERMQAILQNLHNLGFIITEEDCLAESKGESVARPHIVSALLKYARNRELIEDLAEEMKEASLTDASLAEAYNEMIERGKDKYSYSLFLTPNSFKHAYVESRYLPTLDSVVKMIRDAGGLAFFAHYSYERKKVPMYLVGELLKENKLDGVEVVYGLDVQGDVDSKAFKEDKQILKSLCLINNKFMSGGADAHDGEKLRKYVNDLDFSKESIGMAEAMVDSKKVRLESSSYNIKK